jgi:hypothetical protein
MKPLVSIEELSLLLDGELPPEKMAEVRQRLQSCPVSQKLCKRLQLATSSVIEAVLRAPLPERKSDGGQCLSDAALMRLADGTLAPKETAAVEKHIACCETCFAHVVGNLRAASAMRASQWPQLPPEVKNRKEFRSLSAEPEPPKEEENWGRIELVLNREKAAAGTFSYGELSARIIVVPRDGEHARLMLDVEDGDGACEKLAVNLAEAKKQRKIFAGKTDARGHLDIEKISPGEYLLHVGKDGLKVELLIKFEKEA